MRYHFRLYVFLIAIRQIVQKSTETIVRFLAHIHAKKKNKPKRCCIEEVATKEMIDAYGVYYFVVVVRTLFA